MPEVITRPNGKPYRPRKVSCHAVADEWDDVVAVLVLGTHDAEAARPLAEDCVRLWAGSDCTAVRPSTGWWREAIRDGQRWWTDDEARGRAGVRFEVAERGEVP